MSKARVLVERLDLQRDLHLVDLVKVLAGSTSKYLDEVQEIRRTYRHLFNPILSDEFDDLMLQISRVVDTLEKESHLHE